jgi:hypothetical protein
VEGWLDPSKLPSYDKDIILLLLLLILLLLLLLFLLLLLLLLVWYLQAFLNR